MKWNEKANGNRDFPHKASLQEERLWDQRESLLILSQGHQAAREALWIMALLLRFQPDWPLSISKRHWAATETKEPLVLLGLGLINKPARCKNSLHWSTWKWRKKMVLEREFRIFFKYVGLPPWRQQHNWKCVTSVESFIEKHWVWGKTERQITLFWQESWGSERSEERDFLLNKVYKIWWELTTWWLLFVCLK